MIRIKPLFILMGMSLLRLLSSQLYAQDSLFFNEVEIQWIKDHPRIDFGYTPNWPPYEMYVDGKYTGILGEYIHIIERETGIDLVPLKDVTWTESFDRLKKNEIHFVADLAVTEDRKKAFLFSSVIVSDPLILATRRNDNRITDLASLSGLKVAVPENYFTVELLARDYPNIEVIQKASLEECMKSLTIGEVDGVVDGIGGVSYCINNQGFTNIKIAYQTEYKEVEVAMGFSNEWEVFRDIVNKVLHNISIEEKNRIRQKWIAVRFDVRNQEYEIPDYLKYGGALILVILVFLLFWNQTLRKYIKRRKEAEQQLKDSMSVISQQNEERKVLLQEIHHRVKNNLQLVVSLLKLQGVTNQENGESFDVYHSIDRIQAIALIHEKIYQSEDLVNTDVRNYITSLTKTLVENYSMSKHIDFELKIDAINIDIQRLVPLGIILNELITNSIGHAFKDLDHGRILISLTHVNRKVKLVYRDNGKWIIPVRQNSFGESLIESFTEQLNGTCDLNIVNGTEYTISFYLE